MGKLLLMTFVSYASTHDEINYISNAKSGQFYKQ